MADVIVERDGNKSSAGLIVGIVAVVILVLAALYILPGLMNRSNTPATPAPVPTLTTGQ